VGPCRRLAPVEGCKGVPKRDSSGDASAPAHVPVPAPVPASVPGVDELPSLVWRTDPSGRLDYANSAFLEFTGRALADEVGDGWRDRVHPEDIGSLPVAGTRTGGSAQHVFRLLRHDGEYRWIAEVEAPLGGSGSPEGGTLSVATDVTEMRKAEALRQDMVGLVMHELRNPLSVVRGNAELIASGRFDEDGSAVRAMASKIVERSDQMDGIVDELLLAERSRAGTIELALDDVDPVEFTTSCIADLGEPGRRVAVVAEDGLRPCRVDPQRLCYALRNLIGNALKYSPDHEPVIVRVEQTAAETRFAVEDRGDGLDAGDLERVFGRFERACSAPGVTGFGLGLYIADSVAVAHRGRIEAQSDPGRGSVFTLVVPTAG
jgi:PAS domain S-box-containing protein